MFLCSGLLSNSMSKQWTLICNMETERHGPFVQGFHRTLCMPLWNLCSQFLCLHICSLTTFPRWPAISRSWAWGTYFANFRLWNVALYQYLFIYLFYRDKSFSFFFAEWEVILAKNCFDGYAFKYQTQGWTDVNVWVWVSKKFWKEIGSLLACDIYHIILILCFKAFTGCLWAKRDYFFLLLPWCINCLIGLFLFDFCSSNDQPTGNRPHV